MSRLSYVARRPKRLVGALAVALLATAVAIGSGADFSATSANPSNTFAAGTLSIDNSKDNAAIFTPTNMKPGGTPDLGTVDIANSGSLAGVFTLTRTDLTSSDATFPMAAKLNIVVTDCGTFVGATPPTCGDADDSQKYGGTLSAMSSAIALGNFAAGAKHRYQFSAQLDASAGNDYQGDNSSAGFRWDAVQS